MKWTGRQNKQDNFSRWHHKEFLFIYNSQLIGTGTYLLVPIKKNGEREPQVAN